MIRLFDKKNDCDVEAWTDGAYNRDKNIGSFGGVIFYKTKTGQIFYKKFYKKIDFHKSLNITNNRMELLAVIYAIKHIKQTFSIKIITDSMLIVDAFKKNWIYDWDKKDYHRTTKKEIKNNDLWEELLGLTKKYRVKFVWTKAHSNDVYNNYVDEMISI